MRQTGKARVFRNRRNQAVRIPLENCSQGDDDYIRCDSQSGVSGLCEKAFRTSIEEIFAEFDAVCGAAFILDRDLSLPFKRDVS